MEARQGRNENRCEEIYICSTFGVGIAGKRDNCGSRQRRDWERIDERTNNAKKKEEGHSSRSPTWVRVFLILSVCVLNCSLFFFLPPVQIAVLFAALAPLLGLLVHFISFERGYAFHSTSPPPHLRLRPFIHPTAPFLFSCFSFCASTLRSSLSFFPFFLLGTHPFISPPSSLLFLNQPSAQHRLSVLFLFSLHSTLFSSFSSPSLTHSYPSSHTLVFIPFFANGPPPCYLRPFSSFPHSHTSPLLPPSQLESCSSPFFSRLLLFRLKLFTFSTRNNVVPALVPSPPLLPTSASVFLAPFFHFPPVY